MLVGNQNYNGTGIGIIQMCIDGTVRPEAFLLKMIFTALTLGAGYKGGEIVPSFFTGAAFGCLFGTLTGISPTLCTHDCRILWCHKLSDHFTVNQF